MRRPNESYEERDVSYTPSRTATTSPTVRERRGMSWQTMALMGVGLALLAVGIVLELNDPQWWKVLILGVVEGVTEFLPISSTGHLLVAGQLLRYNDTTGGTFDIFIQLGAVIAVVAYYIGDLWKEALRIPSSRTARRFWLAIIIAGIPAAVVGLAVHTWIQRVLYTPQLAPIVITITLIAGGLVFLIVELMPHRPRTTHDPEKVTFPQAIAVGIGQMFALLPGVSRSGGTWVGGLLAGMDRVAVTRFSFYLAIPTLGGATIIDLLSGIKDGAVTSSAVGPLFLGTVVSMIVAWLSIDWLLRFITHHTFIPFGVYRILAGLAIIGLLVAGVLGGAGA